MAGGVAASNPDANVGESALALAIVIVFAVIGGFLVKMIRGVRTGKSFPFCPKKKINGCFSKIKCCKKITIPPLIGEIVFGAIARNFLPSSVMDKYDDSWASYIRMMCLGVILLRGGMELEFKGKGLGVVLLTTIPPLTEGIIVALFANWWLGMTMPLALCLGAVMGAVSPAVLVPCLMNLQIKGFGIVKGIPLTLLAASSFNDVFNIILFSITSTIAYNNSGVQDEAIGGILLTILLEIIGGVASGLVIGLSMKFITHNTGVKIKAFVCLLITTAFIAVCQILHFPEAQFVGIMTYGYLCYRVWGIKGKPEHLLAQIWTFFTPFLFGSIGAALDFGEIDGASILPGIGIVIMGCLARSGATVVSMCVPGSIKNSKFIPKFNWKERGFMAISWLPKATVQAALGGVILDFAKSEDVPSYIKAGNEILTIAVISVILCAPVGAILTISFGQKWLDRKEIKQEDKEKKQKKFSKWDIVYLYVMDYYQRVQDLEKLEEGEKRPDVPFFLTESEKAKRMDDRTTLLYELSLYKKKEDDNLDLDDEIEQHRLEIQAANSELEFASAFSSLMGSRDVSRAGSINEKVMTKKQKKQEHINQLNKAKHVDDIEIQQEQKKDENNNNNLKISNGSTNADEKNKKASNNVLQELSEAGNVGEFDDLESAQAYQVSTQQYMKSDEVHRPKFLFQKQ